LKLDLTLFASLIDVGVPLLAQFIELSFDLPLAGAFADVQRSIEVYLFGPLHGRAMQLTPGGMQKMRARQPAMQA
jgi:hypothetical protein